MWKQEAKRNSIGQKEGAYCDRVALTGFGVCFEYAGFNSRQFLQSIVEGV